MNCDLEFRNKRCEECIRPLCQRDYTNKNNNSKKWKEINNPIINEYRMHDLYIG